MIGLPNIKHVKIGLIAVLGASISLLSIYYFWRGMSLGQSLWRSAPYLVGFFIGGIIGSVLRERKIESKRKSEENEDS